MADTYFDAVLDSQMRPVFNGTTADTVKWLEDYTPEPSWMVCVGKTMQLVPVKAYIAGMKATNEAKIHARNATVLQLVAEAMVKQDTATYHGASSDGMDLVAKETAEKIIKLFS